MSGTFVGDWTLNHDGVDDYTDIPQGSALNVANSDFSLCVNVTPLVLISMGLLLNTLLEGPRHYIGNFTSRQKLMGGEYGFGRRVERHHSSASRLLMSVRLMENSGSLSTARATRRRSMRIPPRRERRGFLSELTYTSKQRSDAVSLNNVDRYLTNTLCY